MNTKQHQNRNFSNKAAHPEKSIFKGAAPVLIFIAAGFILAGQLTDSPLYRECLQDPTINNDYCAKKFLG